MEKTAKKDSRRREHQPPPQSFTLYKPTRSRSFSNDLEREPALQTVCTREWNSSRTTDIDSTPTPEKRNHVNKLIGKFEQLNLSQDVHPNTINKNWSLSFSKGSPPLKYRSESRELSRKLKPSPPPLVVIDDTIVDNTPSPVPNNEPLHNLTNSTTHNTKQLHVLCNCHTEISEGTSSNSLTNKNGKHVFEHIKEVHATEVIYVKKLYVLCFQLLINIKEICEKDENLLNKFSDTYKPILDTLKKLYKFHNETILSQMKQYEIAHHQDNIWLILKEHFETIKHLYKAYYIAYEENRYELEELCSSPLIDKAMLECQVHMENLYPLNELNCGNQRLTRYILLMKTYMKYHDENCIEYENTRLIHDALEQIAIECEEQLIVSSIQLNKLKARIDHKLEYFDNQQLIWHGSLKKRSPRKHTDVVPLYLILFSKCLLVCEESGNKLEVKRSLSIKNIKVKIIESRPLVIPKLYSNYERRLSGCNRYSFLVEAVEKTYEFFLDKQTDRDKWVNKIRQTNEEFERQNSIVEIRKLSHSSAKQHFGNRAPVWVKDIDVTCCQICHTRFGTTKLLHRRHHCRSCGRCICSSCSTKKLVLEYCNQEGEVRVCDKCYTDFTGINKKTPLLLKVLRNPDNTILFGDFYCFSSNSIVWIDLQDDYHLHIYGAKLDQVEQFSINLIKLREILFDKEKQIFILHGKDKPYKFSIESNHDITYEPNDYIDEKKKNTNNIVLFYANLWYETMQSIHSKTVPSWYIKKRNSTDSGISNN